MTKMIIRTLQFVFAVIGIKWLISAVNAITYGFYDLEDVYDQLVTDVEPERIDTAVRTSAEIYRQTFDAILNTLVQRTTARDGAFEIPTSGELQPGSENGTPVPTQNYVEVTNGYPMWRGMDSYGLNREAYAKLSVGGLDKLASGVEVKDARWNIRRALATIFTNVSWTFKEKSRTDLTVRGLAVTGDGSIYVAQNGTTTTANHYTGQADGIISTADPYEANELILRAHPSNTGRIVHYISQTHVAATKLLPGYVPFNPNDGLVAFGANVDVAANVVANYLGFGEEIVGVVGNGIVVMSPHMPDNYVVSIVIGAEKPLVMREEPQDSLQGLQVVPVQVDSNFRKWDYYRKAGYAVRNPIAMAVRRIGNATYAIPSGFDARILPG